MVTLKRTPKTGNQDMYINFLQQAETPPLIEKLCQFWISAGQDKDKLRSLLTSQIMKIEDNRGGGGGASGGGGQGAGWDAHAADRWMDPPYKNTPIGDGMPKSPAEIKRDNAKRDALIAKQSQAQYTAHLQALSVGQEAAEAAFTPNVSGGFYKDPYGTKVNRVAQGFTKTGIQYNPYADALAGGFGSGVETASNGVKGLADSSGLAVGNVWARSVISGADNVLTKADFAATAIPQIGSDLAKTALGVAGLLGPAGSGAMVSKVPTVDLGSGAPAQQHHFTFNVNLDGQPFHQMTATQIEGAFTELATSITRQSG